MENLCIQTVDIYMEKVKKMIQRPKIRDFVLKHIGGMSMYCLGSRAECLHTPTSDTDIMYEMLSIKAVWDQDQARLLRDKPNSQYGAVVILDTNGVHDGYTKVRLFDVNNSNINPTVDLQSLCLRGSQNLSNIKVSEFWRDQLAQGCIFPKQGMKEDLKRNGPCIRFKYSLELGSRHADIDAVFSLKCDWINLSGEWFKRQRNNGWPTKDLMDKIKSFGCNIVPVGHTCSSHRETEWRLSFSKAERELVWSFNGTQYACVDLMKIFFHSSISPEFEDIFPSYFVKTAMFWMVEESPIHVWRPENLLWCLEELLRRIVACLGKKEMCNYFIPSNNMLDTKPSEELGKLHLLLKHYHEHRLVQWEKIMQVLIDGVDKNDIYFHHVHINSLFVLRHYTMNRVSTTEGAKFTDQFYHIQLMLKRAISQNISAEICKMFLNELEVFQKIYGFLNDSKSLEHYLISTTHIDFCSGRLLLATVFLFQENYNDAKNLADNVIRNYGKTIVHYTYHTRDSTPKDEDYEIRLPRSSLEETMQNFIALDVVCLPVLKLFYPKAVKNVLEKTGVVLFIHPLFYAHLIKFHCCISGGNETVEEKAETLQHLQTFTERDPYVTLDLLVSACSEL